MRKRDELQNITNAMYARKPQTVINALTQWFNLLKVNSFF
jgi:hypothetical protein